MKYITAKGPNTGALMVSSSSRPYRKPSTVSQATEQTEVAQPEETFSRTHKVLRTAAGITTSIIGGPSTLIGPLVTPGGGNSGEAGGFGYGVTTGLVTGGVVAAALIGIGEVMGPALVGAALGGTIAGGFRLAFSINKDSKLARVSEAKANILRDDPKNPARATGRGVAQGYKIAAKHSWDIGAGFVDGFLSA